LPATFSTVGSCSAPAEIVEFEDGYPSRLSGMVGSDIRTGAHECFERVVIEFAGSGDMPGVRVAYVDDPVRLSPSDEQVDIAGPATLVVSFGAWMPSVDLGGYSGPADIAPINVEHILELRRIENFEGMAAWAIGLDGVYPFSVDLLDAPARIVIDIADV